MILVEAKRGKFIVFENDKFLGRSLIELGEYMEGQAELFDRIVRPGMVVVEVGANIGAHTVPLSKKASVVYAFEPQRRVYNALCGNLALNGCDNVETYKAAGGEAFETIEVSAMDFEAPDNSIGSFALNEGTADQVKVIPIAIPCHFLKVDVEGYESKVLRGAAGMIREHQPIMYVENDRQELSDELVSTIHDLGYKAYWHITPMYREDNFRKAENPFAGNLVSSDLLCLPKDASCSFHEAKVGEWWN